MAKISKRAKALAQKADRTKVLPLTQAIELVKGCADHILYIFGLKP